MGDVRSALHGKSVVLTAVTRAKQLRDTHAGRSVQRAEGLEPRHCVPLQPRENRQGTGKTRSSRVADRSFRTAWTRSQSDMVHTMAKRPWGPKKALADEQGGIPSDVAVRESFTGRCPHFSRRARTSADVMVPKNAFASIIGGAGRFKVPKVEAGRAEFSGDKPAMPIVPRKLAAVCSRATCLQRERLSSKAAEPPDFLRPPYFGFR